MAELELSLLGPPVVRYRGEELALVARKPIALLLYLAARPARPHSRGHLATLLWEEYGEAEARNNLSTALSRLRQLARFPIGSVGDSLVWRPSAEVATDLAAFERLAELGEAEALEGAVALYRGPFLDGFEVRDSEAYEEWLRQERESWSQRVLGAYHQLVEQHERAGNSAAAIAAARRALVIDPLREQAHRSLMRLYQRGGDRAAALSQFRACERLLRESLDVEPSPETQALREAIVRGEPAGASPAAPSLARPERGSLAPSSPHRARYPLVGRAGELQRLRQVLEETAGSGSRLVVIEGEAGIGKTRLVEEILSQTQGDKRGRADAGRPGGRWTVLLGHSYQDARGLPYHPIIEALRGQLSLLDVRTLDLPDVWLAEVNRLLPELGAQRPNLPAPAQLDPQQERRRLFEGIARMLAALPAPRLFVIEDLHWADSETLPLLAYLVRHEAPRETLFLTTVRTEDVSEPVEQILTGLEYEGWLTRLTLAPLSPATTAELVQAIVEAQAAELAEQAYRETEGNPLFTVELVRSLLEAGAWRPGQELPRLESIGLPPTVQAAIHGRLTRLDPASREFLNSAAVFRRSFDFDEVRTVTGQDEPVALAALETLLRVHLLRETTKPVAAGIVATYYDFGHDQIRRVVYESLSDARRRLLHRRAFDVLAAAAEPRAEELAFHAARSQSWARALDWSERAAGEALRLFAYASAVHLYEQALACAAQLPATPEGRPRAIDLRLRLARAAFYVQPGRLMDWLAPAEADASDLGDQERLATVRLAQAAALYIRGEFTAALPRLEQLQSMAESTGNRALAARTDNILGRLLVIRGELAPGLSALERSLAAAQPESGPAWSPTPLERLASIGLAACAHAFQGQFDLAEEVLGRVRGLPNLDHDAAVQSAQAFYRGLIAHTRGDWDATIANATEAIANARAAANLIYEYVAHVYLGPALAHQGRLADGLSVQRAALALAERARTSVILGRAYAWLGEILLLSGRLDEAARAVEQGRLISDAHGYLLEAAMLDRVRGEILTARGAWEEAASALAGAVAALDALGARPEWARAELTLGRLRLALGDAAQASAHLGRAEQAFAEMGMAWDLAGARATLAGLS